MSDADADLVRRTLAGDQTAFEALVAGHLDRVRAIVGATLGSDQTLDDVVQETFVRAYRRLAQLADPGSFPAWIARIARNESVTWLRRHRRVDTVPLDEASAAIVGEPGEDPVAEARAAALRRLDAALARLRPAYREIVALKYEARLSYEAIAETLGTSVANVEKRLYRARQRLLALMEDEGGVPELPEPEATAEEP